MLYESLTGDLEYFYDELPPDVRRDLSFMLVNLSDENIVDPEQAQDCDAVARSLFAARTRIGRLSDLITVAAIFDVYFAMDWRWRLNAGESAPGRAAAADLIDAIEAAACDWAELRATNLAPAAIAAALLPEGRPQVATARAAG